jgi:hypothetical protein
LQVSAGSRDEVNAVWLLSIVLVRPSPPELRVIEDPRDFAIAVSPCDMGAFARLARFSEGHGKFRYCSCMRWRLTSAQFKCSTEDERIAALERLVDEGTPVGVLAYPEDEPVEWRSIAPLETCQALERYRALPRSDGASVWSEGSFFIDRQVRRRGATLGLLRAADDYARSNGAAIVCMRTSYLGGLAW